MAFDSFSAMLAMEGHGPYVWTCYGVFFLLIGALVWQSLRERRRLVQDQVRQQARPQAAPSGRTASVGSGGFQRIKSSQSETVNKL